MIPADRERAKRVLITGASGLLGLNFALQAAGNARYAVTGVVHHNALAGVPFSVLQADLARPGAVAELLELTRPELVIHCAALANLEACEAQPELAWRLNAGVPGDLAAATAQAGIKLVHISTDAVFDGQAEITKRKTGPTRWVCMPARSWPAKKPWRRPTRRRSSPGLTFTAGA